MKQKIQISVLNYLGKPRDCILQLDCPWCYDAANPGAHRRKTKSSGPEANTAFLGEFWYNGVSDYFTLIAAQRLQSCLGFSFLVGVPNFYPKKCYELLSRFYDILSRKTRHVVELHFTYAYYCLIL